jgi:glycosyltransferase involved in cell wall biosynthesis
MSNKVSVIIPCYNQAQYLDDALSSVLNQTYANWECIIVNDGSTDNTEEIANKWCELDSRFKYVYKKNGGLSSARNAGLSKVNGKYIQFLDADDLIKPNKFVQQLKDLEFAQVSVSDYFSFVDGHIDKPAEHKYLSPVFTKLNYKKEIIWDWEYRKSFPPHCVLFQRKLLDKYHLKFNEALLNHEDWEFWVKLFYYSESLICHDEVLSFYRVRQGSMSTDFIAMRKGFLNAAEILRNFFKEERNDMLYKLSKEKYKEIYNKTKIPVIKKIKSKFYTKLAHFYRKYVKSN